MNIVKIEKLQDHDGHWYWIPVDEVEEFESKLAKLEGKIYMDCPDDFENFIERFNDYQTGGSPELEPYYFHKNGITAD